MAWSQPHRLITLLLLVVAVAATHGALVAVQAGCLAEPLLLLVELHIQLLLAMAALVEQGLQVAA